LQVISKSISTPIVFFLIFSYFKIIELKNGETYNGTLAKSDGFMNMQLKDVIITSPVFLHIKLNKDGDKFWNMPECFIRGNSIKYLRIQDDVLAQAEEDEKEFSKFLYMIMSEKRSEKSNERERARTWDAKRKGREALKIKILRLNIFCSDNINLPSVG